MATGTLTTKQHALATKQGLVLNAALEEDTRALAPSTRCFVPSETAHDTTEVLFVLMDAFSLIAFSGAVETLRLANYISGRGLYRWETATIDGEEVEASCRLGIRPDTSLEQAHFRRNIVLCAGAGVETARRGRLIGWLRRRATEGAHLGALCTATYVLAEAGLLRNHRCTIHWEHLDSFAEYFPDHRVQAELFQIDGARFTCAGGTAAVDMMLRDIHVAHGPALSSKICEQCMHERIREGNEDIRLPMQNRFRFSHPKLVSAIALMTQNTEEVLERGEIARRVSLSHRQLERLFRRYLTSTPARYYLNLRLNKARALLSQTSMPVTEVAFACGFTSASHFSKCYRDTFGKTPRKERQS